MNGRKAAGPRPGQTFDREPARRVFAGELREVNLQFREGEDEKSPSSRPPPDRCPVQPDLHRRDPYREGAAGGPERLLPGQDLDPTGTFFLMAGSDQPEAMQQIARIEPPAFVAVIGKPNLFEPQPGSLLVSVKAESVTTVDRETRDLWVLDTARATLQRLEEMGKTEDSKRAEEQYRSRSRRLPQDGLRCPCPV